MLRGVADAGYRAVELAGLPPIEAEDLRDRLAAAGLRPMGAHESIDGLRADLDGVLDRMAVVGCPRVIVPWLAEDERATVDDARAIARELGALAARCADRGIRFGYHNHAFEFAPLEGTTLWQVLLDELPADVDLELDVYWATVARARPGRADPGVGGRVRLLHMKDMSPEPAHGDVTPGDGILPWPAIVAAGTAAGVEWYVVEEDNPRDVLAEIARGRLHLAGLRPRRADRSERDGRARRFPRQAGDRTRHRPPCGPDMPPPAGRGSAGGRSGSGRTTHAGVARRHADSRERIVMCFGQRRQLGCLDRRVEIADDDPAPEAAAILASVSAWAVAARNRRSSGAQ